MTEVTLDLSLISRSFAYLCAAAERLFAFTAVKCADKSLKKMNFLLSFTGFIGVRAYWARDKHFLFASFAIVMMLEQLLKENNLSPESKSSLIDISPSSQRTSWIFMGDCWSHSF